MLGFARGRGKRAAADPASEVAEEGKIPLDPILMRLQMEMRLVIADFEYSIDRHGNRYGWGIARYTIPETLYGTVRSAQSARPPNPSSASANTSAVFFPTLRKTAC